MSLAPSEKEGACLVHVFCATCSRLLVLWASQISWDWLPKGMLSLETDLACQFPACRAAWGYAVSGAIVIYVLQVPRNDFWGLTSQALRLGLSALQFPRSSSSSFLKTDAMFVLLQSLRTLPRSLHPFRDDAKQPCSNTGQLPAKVHSPVVLYE